MGEFDGSKRGNGDKSGPRTVTTHKFLTRWMYYSKQWEGSPFGSNSGGLFILIFPKNNA